MATAHARATYRNDLLRAPFHGILEAGWNTFALVIAIRYFDASETHKAFIAGSGPIGFLLTPLTLYFAATLKARASLSCVAVFTTATLLLIGASFAQSLLWFTLLIVTSQMAAVQQGPLMLQIYTENYSASERGKRMAWPFMLTAACSVVFAYVCGQLLDWHLDYYVFILLIMAAATAVSALAYLKIPSQPLALKHIGNPWQNMSLIWKDRFFGYLLGSWMLLGLGNLIALPVRVDYLANPDYGINANNTTIAVLMLVIPAIARILFTHIWGRCFDRLHFITTRNLLNSLFLISIGLFFFTTNIWLLALAMACQGAAMGGGKIIWNLWVTKIASEEKAASYMSVHMALTGLRGSLAPFIGYWILASSAPSAVAMIGMLLIALSILLFEFARGHQRLKATTT